MTAPTFGAATATFGSSISYPSGITAGQLLILHIALFGSAPSAPSGFTSVGSVEDSFNGVRHCFYKKTATGSESGSLSLGANYNAALAWFANGDSATIGAAGDAGFSSLPSLTTSAADSLATLWTYYGGENPGPYAGSATGETGGNWTEAFDAAQGGSEGFQLQTAAMASAGTISGGTIAFSDTLFYASAATLAITPAAGGGTDATATPGAGSLALSGQAPSVSAGSSVAPGSQALALTGFAPAISAGVSVAPGASALVITGFAPDVQATQNQTVDTGVGSITITGYAPAVDAQSTQDASAEPGSGTLTITGYQPTVSVNAELLAFDTHDGSPRTNYKAREDRERDNREKLREAIETAVLSVFHPASASEAVIEPVATPVPSSPPKLSAVQVRSLAEALVETSPQVAGTDLRKLRQEIRAVERRLRAAVAERARIEREIEEEDEMILLLVA